MDHLSFDFLKRVISRMQATGFEQAEVILVNEHLTELQVDFSDFSLLRNTESDLVTLRGLSQGRFASVTLNQIDEVSLQNAIMNLQESAQSAPVDECRMFAPSQLIPTNEMGPLEPMHYQMHERLSQFLKDVRDTYPECLLKQSLLRYTRTRTMRLNTAGLQIDSTEGHYHHGVRFLSKRNGKTSSINYSGAYANDLETDLLSWGNLRSAIENSSREIAALAFEGRLEGPIVVSPEAFTVLLNLWSSHLKDERLISGTSRFKAAIDKPVVSPMLTLEIEPRNPAFAKQDFFTEDGYGSEPSTIVRNGVLKSYMLSDYGARKTKLPRGENSGANWVVAGGTKPLGELFGDVEKGLFLGRISGGIPAVNGDFAIIAKNSFLIESGFITKPVTELMLSGNIFDILSAVTAVSRERASDGMTIAPWVCVEGLTAVGR